MPVTPIKTLKELRDSILQPAEGDKPPSYPPAPPGPYTNPEGATYMRSGKGVFVLVPHNRMPEAMRKGYKPMGMGELAQARLNGEKAVEMVPPPVDPTKGPMRGYKNLARIPVQLDTATGMGIQGAALGTDPREHPVEAMAEAGGNMALIYPELTVARRALLSGGGAAAGSLLVEPTNIKGAATNALTRGVVPEILSGGPDKALKIGTAGKSEQMFGKLEEIIARRIPRLDEATRKVIVEDVKDWLADFVASPINEPVKEKVKKDVPIAVGAAVEGNE